MPGDSMGEWTFLLQESHGFLIDSRKRKGEGYQGEAVFRQQMECGEYTYGGFQPMHLHWGPGTRLRAGGMGQMTLDKPLSLQFMSDEVLAIT